MHQDRYEEKLNFIGPVDDPYVLPIPASPCTELLPDVEYPVNYLNTPCPVTKEELKAYKSLEGYEYLKLDG